MALPVSTIYISSGLHPFPIVVYEGLGCGDRNIFECRQHISDVQATGLQSEQGNERKVLGPGCGHFQSTEMRLGMRRVREGKGRSRKTMDPEARDGAILQSVVACAYCSRVGMA